MCISSKVGGKCAITSVEADLVLVGIPKVVAGAELMCAADPDLSLMSVCAFCSTSSELFNASACNVIAIRIIFFIRIGRWGDLIVFF